MNQLTATPFDFAFVPTGTPMFSDLIEQITANEALSETRRRDLISGLNRVAKALNRAPQEIPAYGRWLQPRLEKLNPVALGLTVKSWQNAVSDARSAMTQCGLIERRWSRPSDLTPEWYTLWTTVLSMEDPTLPLALSRFVYFLSWEGVAPQDVRDEHAFEYLEAVTANEISKSPMVAYRAAVNGWNLAVKRVADWPRTRLTLPSNKKVFRLETGELPASFHADLEAILDRLANPDPLAEDGPTRARRPATVKQYRTQIVRFASELVHSGFAADDITEVAVLLDPATAERGLRQMLARNSNKTNKLISETAALLRNFARLTGRSDTALERLKKLASKVALPPQRGMTPKNRDRLRVLQDEQMMRRLLLLPERLFANPPRGKANTYTKALAREDAVAIGILLYCPIRVKNLANIHLEQHLLRPGDGRVFLVLTEDETKTERPLEFELPSDLVRMIDAHLKTRCPEMCPKGTPWLFPRRDGQAPMNEVQLSGRIRKRIRETLGAEMNAHLFRHFAVMLLLDAQPGSYEVARRLLGHSEVSHTINMYSGLEMKTAIKRFAELVNAKKRGSK